ncbi:DUF6361 family protein [Pseudobutyrivibrio xylanivorans]|uniref:Uncharacterized protein n=1 Tax=Pseudobutyrivibrio xylanivorans DSM 14809 TaxID=1123012 RepID=A0A1M6HLJ6_PSEXY|nr:DUF6361 family protein [Pseudobutyrivibrio xylanivorans]SHJ23040.1 hypothetical protein SAMN02745725_02053 [Pseudobutyrivibrio xylanivorans DSM 14809]
MPIGWIDFSKDERNKVLNVIHLLDEPGAVDELGIGAIRDAFADYFFPGTSTVQTRAKYFLIVPYVLFEAGNGKYGSDINTILRRIDSEERNCRDILIKTSNDGVIGSLVPRSWVLRTPSNIYWNGIKRIGIFKEDLSVKEYIHQSIIQRNLKQTKAYGNRDKDAEENEKDDVDAGDITSIQFWSLGDTYHSDWRDNLSIELLPGEAAFLRTQIITTQRNSLFAFILKNNIELDKYSSFGALTEDIKESVDEELRYMMELANDFNNLVSIITTRYNLIVSGGNNEYAQENWELYSKDLKRRSEVDLKAIFHKLDIRNLKLKTFLIRVQDAIRDDDIEAVDNLIVKREIALKGPKRAKTNRVGEFKSQNWIGIDRLDYRYTPAKRIIRDIMNAEVV